MLFSPKEQGQSLVEYALILVLIALAVIIGLTIFGESLVGVYNQIIGAFP